MGKKLLLIGNTTIHTYNYYNLIKPYFDEIVLITDIPRIDQKVDRIEYVSFTLRSPGIFFKTVSRIRKVCNEFKPDIIHVHQINSVAFYAIYSLKNTGIPIVSTAWGSDILITPHRSFILRQLVKYCLKYSDMITADAEYLGQEVLKYIPDHKEKLVIANFGMKINAELLNTPKEDIIYSNRLHKPLYNIDEIIRAFKKMQDHKPNNYTLVVGAVGEETENLKKLAVDLGIKEKVKFVGWLNLEENQRWYARSKFYVSIPDSDATSISLLEAMYYGCYPIVSSLPAKREWISEEVNGSYYKGDLNFVLDITPDELTSVARINKKVVELKGTVEVAYKKFTAIYDILIKRNNAKG
jgi:glycosyltransferase involved in cell wall biosynthesis